MHSVSDRALDIAARVEAFVRGVVIPFEKDRRRDHHGAPTEELVAELRKLGRAAGVMTPHILGDGAHLTQRETAIVLKASGLSPLGPVALNTAAPDEGNMYLLGKVGNAEIKRRFLPGLASGRTLGAWALTEPGSGSDSVAMKTRAEWTGRRWVINGTKMFITQGSVGGV